jgi:hypothetical protein
LWGEKAMAKASMTNPLYKMNLVKANGTKYQFKDITTDLVVSNPSNELAEKVTVSLVDVKVGSKRLHSLIALKDKVYVYANTGDGYKEVFRGFVWEREFAIENSEKEVKLICYYRLIYLHNCKDNLFVKKGKKTKDVITSLAKKWGFKISYKYKSISHSKLVYHNMSVADILIDILEKTSKKTGVKYAVRMDKNVIVIDSVGINTKIYNIKKKENAIGTNYRQTMEGMVTKVLIVKPEKVKKGESEE